MDWDIAMVSQLKQSCSWFKPHVYYIWSVVRATDSCVAALSGWVTELAVSVIHFGSIKGSKFPVFQAVKPAGEERKGKPKTASCFILNFCWLVGLNCIELHCCCYGSVTWIVFLCQQCIQHVNRLISLWHIYPGIFEGWERKPILRNGAMPVCICMYTKAMQ